MRNNNFKVILILLLSLFSNRLTAQTDKYIVIKSAPSYTLQFNINYNQSALELSGAYNDDNQSINTYNGSSFGADKGYGAGLISKISLHKSGNLRFTQSISYNRLLTYTFGDKENIADRGKSEYNCFTGGLGLECNFTPTKKFKIYVGSELNISLINGNVTVWFNPALSDTTYKILNSLRGGFGLSIGGEYLLSDNFGLHLGARFINANFIGKKSEGSNSDMEFKLRDAADPNLKFAGDKNKSFSFYNILLGINFYFGVETKKYKIN